MSVTTEGPYTGFYRNLIGTIPEGDLRLLQEAEWLDWGEIYPHKAETPAAQSALRSIARHKYHCEEASCGCC